MRIACAWVGLLLAAAAASAAVRDAAEVKTQVRRVALFKNGLGFFTRGGNLPERAGRVELAPFAAPSHGTMWISYPANVGLGPVIAREAAVKEKREATSLAELLRANVGKQVTVWLSAGADKPQSITGTILPSAWERKPQAADPYAMGGMRAATESRFVPPAQEARLVLLKTDSGVVAANPGQVQRVDFAGEAATAFEEEAKGVEMSLESKKPARDAWVSVSYLAKGITWAPSYLVDISDAKKARVAAKGVIINEAEDLKGAQVELVTGFPNLQFADVMDPMGVKEDLARFLQSLAGRRPESEERRGVMTQSALYRGDIAFLPPNAPMPVPPEYGAAAAGRAAEDLFLYPLEDVTLAKGERGYYPLFTETVPYEEIYQWQIPDYINEEDQYGRRRQEREQVELPEMVWHCLKLTNTMKLPWTTAPAETTKEGQILGQDTLNYTPPKGEATLRITQAMSVKAEQVELEVNRERGVAEYYGYQYDRVTIEGRLRVHNFQEKAISLEIKKSLSGEVKRTTPTARDQALARGLKQMNPNHVLTWNIELKPGAEQELTYVYEALIRR